MKKLILILALSISWLFVSNQQISANEGVVQMEALDESRARCFVVSTLLANFEYKMLVNCRGLSYPIAQNLFQYVMWADHGEDSYSRLGSLGVGKREFASTQPFNRLFVTKEANDQPEQPSSNLYMSAGISAISFLEGVGIDVASPTPAPQPQEDAVEETVVETNADADLAGMSPGSLIRILGIGVVVVVILVVVIAFVSASRRRPMDI